jgi:hypothetical protein
MVRFSATAGSCHDAPSPTAMTSVTLAHSSTPSQAREAGGSSQEPTAVRFATRPTANSALRRQGQRRRASSILSH